MEAIEQAGEICAQRGDAFILLARRIALGEGVDGLVIADTITKAGRSEAELEDLVSQFRSRAQLRAKIESARQLERRRDALIAKRDKANAELEAAVEKHDAIVNDIRHRKAAIGEKS